MMVEFVHWCGPHRLMNVVHHW